MTLLLIRTIILYFITLIALKAMGKRQLGQLQPFDFVILLIISQTASLAMQSNTVSLVNSVIPIAVLTILQIILSLANLKSEKIRSIACGDPVTLIKNGKFQENELAKLRVNINDILEQCRIQGYFDISALDTVLMETNGQISIFPKTTNRPLEIGDIKVHPPQEVLPFMVILDGHVNRHALQKLGYNETWLDNQLKMAKVGSAEQIFAAGIDISGKFFFQKKGEIQ